MANANVKKLLAMNENLAKEQERKKVAWDKTEEVREIVMTRGDKVKAVPVKWLWPGYLPQGTPLCWSGASGAGKSPVVTDTAARVSAGLVWPDGTTNTNGSRDVLFVSSEDDIPSVVVPRLEAAGADMNHIFFIEGSRRKGGDSYLDTFALDRDLDAIREKVKDIPDLALCIIDPVTNHLGKAKYTDTQQVRDVLNPFHTDLCQKLGVCLIYITHINRRDSDTTSVQQLVLGAEAYLGMSRMGYFFGASKEDEKYEHTMAEFRNGSASSLRYRTGSTTKTIAGVLFEDIRTVEWLGASKATAEEIASKAPREDNSKIFEGVVLTWLRGGSRSVAEIQKDLQAQFPIVEFNKSLMSKLQKHLKKSIVSYQKGKHDWWWKSKPESKARKF